MALIDQVRKWFTREKPVPTTSDEMRRPSQPTFAASFGSDQERRATVQTCRKMYKSDPRAKGVINTVARDVAKGGLRVRVPENPQAEEIANGLLKRIKLSTKLDDWTRLTLRDGDSYLEIGVDARQEIALVTRKPTLQVRRNSNDNDGFEDPQRAYWLAPEDWVMDYPPSDATWFADWQVVHVRWDHDEGSRYGTPLFASATSAYKRMTEGELDIAVRRKTRAGMKFLHVLDGASAQEIEAYKADNADALDNPFAAVADFFSNRPGSISAIQGDANLSQIEDVMHQIRTWWTASPVPMSLMGYGQDINRDILEEQAKQYRENLEQIKAWAEDEIVVPLLERQWLLAGILPEGLDYEIVWQAKETLSATDLVQVVDAAMRMRILGVRDDLVAQVLARFLPVDVDTDDLFAGYGEADSPERLAAAMDALRGGL